MSVFGWFAFAASAWAVGGAIGWASVALPYTSTAAGSVARGIQSAIVPDRQSIRLGAWTTSREAGGQDADMFTRSRVARTGLLALNRTETIYFFADRDEEGLPLEARCNYEVTGTGPEAKWWSLTVYADDHFLVDDVSGRYSINVRHAEASGAFKLLLGPKQRPGLWLPTGNDGGFNLLLRLYNPAAAIVSDPRQARVPKIVRMGGCS